MNEKEQRIPLEGKQRDPAEVVLPKSDSLSMKNDS